MASRLSCHQPGEVGEGCLTLGRGWVVWPVCYTSRMSRMRGSQPGEAQRGQHTGQLGGEIMCAPKHCHPQLTAGDDISVQLSCQEHTCLHITLKPCPSAPGAHEGLSRGCEFNSRRCLEDLGVGSSPSLPVAFGRQLFITKRGLSCFLGSSN